MLIFVLLGRLIVVCGYICFLLLLLFVRLAHLSPTWEMAGHMTAADDVLWVPNFVVCSFFPHGVLGWIWD